MRPYFWVPFVATPAIFVAQSEAWRLSPLQHPLMNTEATNLHGRFLHITDMHMDSYYQVNATIKSECHRPPKKHKNRKWRQGKLAGDWGAPTTECDAPPQLIDHTINWISHEWKHKIDFVIWTGDNARHDIDGKLPRTRKEILGYNQRLTDTMQQAFTLEGINRTIPIVPVIVDKDKPILLKDFVTMWRDFIPLDQVDVFKRGGYFAVDVVPGVRVLSLNTLYFFNSNDAVHACRVKGGTAHRHMSWISEQLAKARQDGVKVYMIGHVPPSAKTFRKSCLSQYVDISLEYADVIAGHMYGHANLDHFQILTKEKQNRIEIEKNVEQFVSDLREQYQQAREENNTSAIVVHVAPPVLPLYYSAFRINQYDTSRANFGQWQQYTQWYTNLTYWNQQPAKSTPEFEIEYTTNDTYNMSDLGVDSWLRLAVQMTEDTREAQVLWNKYLNNMFVQTSNDYYLG
ncbi:Endopolyphosphatase [Apophysomyces sp. BC1034]|nr:Endopolyphosphatase [Apophysomyces sp. BC1015]KAG0178845.1 Endopolyphosphatase [Apophysomyces sp. BC1021]KAG0189015.1 Endopolyphosphatase [Apophysomyces sp. BC1034]